MTLLVGSRAQAPSGPSRMTTMTTSVVHHRLGSYEYVRCCLTKDSKEHVLLVFQPLRIRQARFVLSFEARDILGAA